MPRMQPLAPDRFSRLLPLLEPLTLNTLFVRAVLVQGQRGHVLADSPDAPRARRAC